MIDDAVVVEYRESLELMPIGRDSCKYSMAVPDSILNSDKIEQVMHENDYTHALTCRDCVFEYSHIAVSGSICIRFRRDRTKRGYLHCPYRVSILMPNRRVYRYTVRSVGQLRKALRHWKKASHCNVKK